MSSSPTNADRNWRRFVLFRVLFNSRFYYPVLAVLFLDLGLSATQYTLLNFAWALAIVLFGLAFLVYPDGGALTSRWRWVIRAYVVLGGTWIAGAWALSGTVARRAARPVEELAEAAGRLGTGDPRPVGRRYGVTELDQVADGLDSAARRVTTLLTADRELAIDASHQLRTPLTALSMRLEEMIADRKSTRLNSSHSRASRMPSSA